MNWPETRLKSAVHTRRRIFVAFGKVNNTQEGDYPYSYLATMALIFAFTFSTNSGGRITVAASP